MSEMSDPFVTIPSFVCLGIIIVSMLAVLLAPRRYVHGSFLVMVVSIVGYAAILAITTAGSINPNSPTEEAATQASESSSSGGDTLPAPTDPLSDGSSEGY